MSDIEADYDVVPDLRRRGWYASDGAGGSSGPNRPRSFIPDVLCAQAADEIARLRVAASILAKMAAIDAIDIAGGKAWFLVDDGNIAAIDLDEIELAYLAALTSGGPHDGR